MPGSKRRALKKLLSPTSTPPSSSPSNALDSTASLTSNQSISSGIDSDATLEEMTSRENEIGAGTSKIADGVGDLNSKGRNGSAAGGSLGNTGLYPQQMTAEQLMFGDEANGGGGGKGKKKSSKQRFAERQARRQEAVLASAPPSDPDWNAQLEKERQAEIRIIGDACAQLGRVIHEIPPDGHCMYNAIADQLAQIGLLPEDQASDPKHIRLKTAQFMLQNPDDFMPFLPSIQGEDSAGATTHDGLMTNQEFEKYCQLVAETGEWGGEPEIQALSRLYGIPIHVFQSGPPTVVSHGGTDDTFGGGLTPAQSASQGDRVVRISYHKRMYGLGEHYNSLRKAL